MAKFLAEDQPTCLSGRLVGAVIVDENFNKVIGTGYNGPPKKLPNCDTKEHYDFVVTPQCKSNIKWTSECKGKCPRRMLNIPSGEQLNLCTCEHAEKNAIYNCNGKSTNMTMYCWCGVPCQDCTKAIINFGIKKVVCLEKDIDYSTSSKWMLISAGIELVKFSEQDILCH